MAEGTKGRKGRDKVVNATLRFSYPSVVLPFLLLTLSSFASSSADFLRRGNEAYESADYATALALYDSALVAGPDARLLYNRGNAGSSRARPAGRWPTTFALTYSLRTTPTSGTTSSSAARSGPTATSSSKTRSSCWSPGSCACSTSRRSAS